MAIALAGVAEYVGVELGCPIDPREQRRSAHLQPQATRSVIEVGERPGVENLEEVDEEATEGITNRRFSGYVANIHGGSSFGSGSVG
ncbi:hypothetical protein [Nonomuraea rhizosphaerae]|uniref:hypothetical protein n=1 Tax=Nonomuraea rhizosphaerae TaxID=2665663 RepID=UPI001C5F01E8|nr:hypothetical protein [Nonomuraea rhizosphaerae]